MKKVLVRIRRAKNQRIRPEADPLPCFSVRKVFTMHVILCSPNSVTKLSPIGVLGFSARYNQGIGSGRIRLLSPDHPAFRNVWIQFVRIHGCNILFSIFALKIVSHYLLKKAEIK